MVLTTGRRLPVANLPQCVVFRIHKHSHAKKKPVASEAKARANSQAKRKKNLLQVKRKPIMSPNSLMWCVGITSTRLDGSCDSMLSHVTLSSLLSGCMAYCVIRRCVAIDTR